WNRFPASDSLISSMMSVGVAVHEPAFRRSDKIDYLIPFLGGRQVGFYFLVCGTLVQAVEVVLAVYLLNMIDRITGKAPSSQSQGIDASIAKGFARCFGIGGDIFSHQGTTRNQGMHADPYKLMNGAASANNCPFVDGDVPSHLYGVSYNHVVADDTVMGNVHISHQKTGFSYFGCLFI